MTRDAIPQGSPLERTAAGEKAFRATISARRSVKWADAAWCAARVMDHSLRTVTLQGVNAWKDWSGPLIAALPGASVSVPLLHNKPGSSARHYFGARNAQVESRSSGPKSSCWTCNAKSLLASSGTVTVLCAA
jgi:hypothetical protein